MSSLQTRRDALRLALSLAVTAAVPATITSTFPAEGAWEQLIGQVRCWGGPGLQLALHHARRAGMDVGQLAWINFPNRSSAWVSFYLEGTDEMRSFDADGERAYHS